MATYSPTPAALSRNARLAMSAPGVDSPVDELFGFTRFNTGCSQETIDTAENVNTGQMGHLVSRVRNNLRRVNPTLSMRPTVGEWAKLLQWVLGGTPTGDGSTGSPFTYPLGEREVGRATFRAAQGQPLELDLDCVGVDWTNTGTFPTGLVLDLNPTLIMTDLAVTVAGIGAVKCRSWTLTVEKMINRDRFFNSATIAGAVMQDRKVTVGIEVPWGLHQALWAAGAGVAGVAVTATFTYGTQALSFAMPACRAPESPIEANVPEEIFYQFDSTCFMPDDTTNELTVTLVTATS